MPRKYKNTFLYKVIVRIDFAEGYLESDVDLPLKQKKQIFHSFPIVEPTQITHTHVTLTSESQAPKRKDIEETHLVFYGAQREKKLTIAPSFFHIEYDEYISIESLIVDFESVIGDGKAIDNGAKLLRLGLRYINNIALDEGNPLDWSNYLKSNLLGIFDIPDDKSTIARAFHILELNFGEFLTTIQYGMHNPDYPATIRKKLFILDFDSYVQSDLRIDNLKQQLLKFRDKTENLFEACIENGLREIMGEIENEGQQ